MTQNISELVLSRAQTDAQFDTDDDSAELSYVITDSNTPGDEAAARALLLATAPPTYNGMPLVELQLVPNGCDFIWTGTANYRTRTTFAQSFDTTGGSFKITNSLATQKFARANEVAPDHKGAINVQEDGRVEGVDIVIPSLKFSEVHEIANSVVTDSYISDLSELTGRVNDAPFRGFDAGEVLFVGATGSHRGSSAWEITFNFVVSKAENLNVGAVNGVSKGGHEYLWVSYSKEADNLAIPPRQVSRPAAVYVEKVYEEDDFTRLQLPV